MTKIWRCIKCDMPLDDECDNAGHPVRCQMIDDYVRNAEVIRVVDGDTLDVLIDLGCNVHRLERVRLFGINAPEIRGEQAAEGRKATLWLTQKLAECNSLVVVQTIRDVREKYGRYLARIYEPGSDCSLNEQMIAAGHAKPFME